jgi:hypothetical protein
MKLISQFEKFLVEEVNLNQSRIDTLTDRVAAAERFLTKSDWIPPIKRFSAQGSWAHKTIIKPPEDQGFDADLLVFVDPVDGWTASDYMLSLRGILNASAAYADKTTLRTRCITIGYAGDFDIDIVPCLTNRPGGSHHYEVCNRTDDVFEATDSEAYTDWFDQRNSWTGSDRLREVTRLLKYLRDIKETFTCKSILLTTLLGMQVTQADALYQATYFSDLPTAFKTLMGRLDDYLQARIDLHDICNPVLPEEDFVRHWDRDKYTNFRDMIHKYRGWIDEAYADQDESESVTKWQRVFGDEFGKGTRTAIAKFGEAAVQPVPINRLQFRDAVQAVQSLGRHALDTVRSVTVPWMKSPLWRMASQQSTVAIRATAHRDRTGSRVIGAVQSGEVLRPGIELLFEAVTATGMLFPPKEYDIHWQVVNTDMAARDDEGLRGGFYRPQARGGRWESTKYRGVHWVQAFVIRRRDRVCVGRSERFFVVIE